MKINGLTYHRGIHGKAEYITAAVIIGNCSDRIGIHVEHLCGRLANHYTERGFLVPPCAQLEMLRFVKLERDKILAEHPVKTRAGWTESGISNFMDYCSPGDEVDEALVDYFLNVVPPATHRTTFIQAGEPYSSALDDTGKYQAIYSTFSKGSTWRYLGECFLNQTENKVSIHSKLERAITALSKQT